jgi:hypothetical protein
LPLGPEENPKHTHSTYSPENSRAGNIQLQVKVGLNEKNIIVADSLTEMVTGRISVEFLCLRKGNIVDV